MSVKAAFWKNTYFFLEILLYLFQAGFTLDVDKSKGLTVVSVEDVGMRALVLGQFIEAVCRGFFLGYGLGSICLY